MPPTLSMVLNSGGVLTSTLWPPAPASTNSARTGLSPAGASANPQTPASSAASVGSTNFRIGVPPCLVSPTRQRGPPRWRVGLTSRVRDDGGHYNRPAPAG